MTLEAALGIAVALIAAFIAYKVMAKLFKLAMIVVVIVIGIALWQRAQPPAAAAATTTVDNKAPAKAPPAKATSRAHQ